MIHLGPFQLIERAGSGAMAEVWRAEHRTQQQPVAVKIVTGKMAADPQFRSRFAHEVRAVARLNHPGVVRLLDYGETLESFELGAGNTLPSGAPYLVMEWISGGTLRPHLGRMRWMELRTTLLSLLDALSSAHAHELVHRDLKPDNVLLSERGPVLSDFGVAFAGDSAQSRGGEHAMVGTPNYMAPEQIKGHWRAFGPWTDLYALGCLTYALVCGRAPYAGSRFAEVIKAHVNAPIPNLQPRITVPLGFDHWVKRLMSKSPSDRFQLAADAAIALLDYPEAVTETGEEKYAVCDGDEGDETVVSPPVFVPVSDMSWAYEARCGDRPGLPSTWRLPDADRQDPPLVGVGRSLIGLAQPPFCGRENERDLLWGKLRQVTTGEGAQIVFVRGPAGQGKTALVRWIACRAQEVGSALPLMITHQRPNGPSCGLRGLLERSLRCEGLDGDAARSRVTTILDRVGMANYSAVLGEMVKGETSLVGDVTQSIIFSKDERFEAVCNYLHYLGERRPRVLIVDDLQWGTDTLAFLEYFFARWAHVPVLVMITVQDDAETLPGTVSNPISSLVQSLKGQVLALGPLAPPAHHALLESRITLDADVVEQLTERTGGNPLFTQEILQDWIRKGVLVPGPEGFRLRTSALVQLPDGIRSLWHSRLDVALDPPQSSVRQALEIASVLGQTVRQDELDAVCKNLGLDLDPTWAERCFDERLIEPAGTGRWNFTHALLRETLQETARDNGSWAAWHGACASTLSDRIDVAPERLGEHLMAAGKYAQAVEPFIRSADFLRFRSDYGGARRWLLRAAQALRKQRVPRDGLEWAEVRSRWSICARVRGDFGSALRQAKRVRLAAELHDNKEMLARSLLELGRCIDTIQDTEIAIPYYHEAAEVARASGSAKMIINCLSALGRAYRGVSDFARSRAIYEEALAQCDPEQLPMLYGTALLGMARLELFSDAPTKGAKLAREAYQRFSSAGSRWAIAQSLSVLGDAERYLGNLRKAEEAYWEAAEILKAIGSIDAPYGDANLAIALMEQGRWAEAAVRVSVALKAAKKVGSRKSALLIGGVALLTDARTHDWEAWDTRVRFLQPMVDGTLADLDVANSSLSAARYCDSVDEKERGDFAWTLAIRQFELLGKEELADTARREWAAGRYA